MSNVADDRDLYSILSQIYAEDKRVDNVVNHRQSGIGQDPNFFPDAIAKQRKADAEAAGNDIMLFPDVVTGYQQKQRKEAIKLDVKAVLEEKEAAKRKKKHNIKEGLLLFMISVGVFFGVSCAAFALLFGLNTWKIAVAGFAAVAVSEMGLMMIE